jgi:PIN domain nuclease of toxin-antitoxin system
VVGDPVELAAAIEASGFAELPIRSSHAVGVAALPPHHADPFDRILVAQALAEPLRLVTADPVLSQYGELVILVPS